MRHGLAYQPSMSSGQIRISSPALMYGTYMRVHELAPQAPGPPGSQGP